MLASLWMKASLVILCVAIILKDPEVLTVCRDVDKPHFFIAIANKSQNVSSLSDAALVVTHKTKLRGVDLVEHLPLDWIENDTVRLRFKIVCSSTENKDVVRVKHDHQGIISP